MRQILTVLLLAFIAYAAFKAGMFRKEIFSLH